MISASPSKRVCGPTLSAVSPPLTRIDGSPCFERAHYVAGREGGRVAKLQMHQRRGRRKFVLVGFSKTGFNAGDAFDGLGDDSTAALPLGDDRRFVHFKEQFDGAEQAADFLFADLHAAADGRVRVGVEVARGNQVFAPQDQAR